MHFLTPLETPKVYWPILFLTILWICSCTSSRHANFQKRQYLDLKTRNVENPAEEVSVNFVERSASDETDSALSLVPPCDTIVMKNGKVIPSTVILSDKDKVLYRQCCSEHNSGRMDTLLSECDSNEVWTLNAADVDFILWETGDYDKPFGGTGDREIFGNQVRTCFTLVLLGLAIAAFITISFVNQVTWGSGLFWITLLFLGIGCLIIGTGISIAAIVRSLGVPRKERDKKFKLGLGTVWSIFVGSLIIDCILIGALISSM